MRRSPILDLLTSNYLDRPLRGPLRTGPRLPRIAMLPAGFGLAFGALYLAARRAGAGSATRESR